MGNKSIDLKSNQNKINRLQIFTLYTYIRLYFPLRIRLNNYQSIDYIISTTYHHH